MSGATLTRMRLVNGVWEGLLSGREPHPPKLRIRHRDDLVGEPETSPAQDRDGWTVRFHLPLDRLSDGVQTFVIEDARTGEALAHETVIAGDEVSGDLRAELALLKAELDLLKRAFRRHCSETT
ncbi:hypothetical protein [Silicimonas sp. MF1-12-2]|uniref:hypothetical protein n=1 Tax=Silicimonas sp. MF1-12-2 TaxID=3384793 RepID=UPI0039B3EB75